jgi:hypothetical protein
MKAKRQKKKDMLNFFVLSAAPQGRGKRKVEKKEETKETS